jgi:cytochrome c-type biogenesis protein CcmH
MERREFLARSAGALVVLQQPAADPLRNPGVAGRARLQVTAADNDEIVKGIERRLKCTCGCNLDIFTCRTTDFTCAYSPALHLEVVALRQAGKSPEDVLAAFVAKYGEQALMAPPPRGFNLAGYLVPGLAVLAAGTILALVLLRRRREVAAAVPAPSPAGAPSSEDMERLRRALSEVAD